MNWHYTVYGLSIQSNTAIPGLIAIQSRTAPVVDIHAHFGPFPRWIQNLLAGKRTNSYISPLLNPTSSPYLCVDIVGNGTYIHFQYDNGIQFVLNQETTEVWCTWPKNLTISYVALPFLGLILTFILGRRAVTCLHASCIAIEDRAFAILGWSGAGKSTTAAAFAIKGNTIVADDVLPLAEQNQDFKVIPSYPRLRLWSDVVEFLYGAPDAQPLLTPNWEKRYIDLVSSGYKFASTLYLLEAIYILNPRSNEPTAPFITSESLSNNLFALSAHTFGGSRLLDKSMRKQEFNRLCRLVTRVPVRHVKPHKDIIKLSKLCDVILEDFQALKIDK